MAICGGWRLFTRTGVDHLADLRARLDLWIAGQTVDVYDYFSAWVCFGMRKLLTTAGRNGLWRLLFGWDRVFLWF